ncbi:peptidylprolyl isomerase [Candidatus Woesearchaeota archaeon]|nr:peptidylprolyl isomerase [Candidatus Woesearchaeota archaeon]
MQRLHMRTGRVLLLIALLLGGVLFYFRDPLMTRFSYATGRAATVNGEPIMVADVDRGYAALGDMMSRVTRLQLLDELIAQKLLMQAVAAADVTVSEEEVEEILNEQAAAANMTLDEALATFGEKAQELHHQLRSQLLVAKYLNKSVLSDIRVTTKDAKDYYENHTEEFVLPEQVHVAHILIKTEGKTQRQLDLTLQALLDELKAGVSFADLAANYSEDSGSALNGGDLGSVYKGQTVPEFETVAFATSVNHTSKTFRTQFGFHILKVYDKSPSRTLSFGEVEQKLVQLLLRQQQQDAFLAHLKQLRQDARVHVYINE